MGDDRAERASAYRALFADAVGNNDAADDTGLAAIRAAWRTGTPLGNERFREEIERTLKTKVGYARRGRPKSKGLAESSNKAL